MGSLEDSLGSRPAAVGPALRPSPFPAPPPPPAPFGPVGVPVGSRRVRRSSTAGRIGPSIAAPAPAGGEEPVLHDRAQKHPGHSRPVRSGPRRGRPPRRQRRRLGAGAAAGARRPGELGRTRVADPPGAARRRPRRLRQRPGAAGPGKPGLPPPPARGGDRPDPGAAMAPRPVAQEPPADGGPGAPTPPAAIRSSSRRSTSGC